MTRTIATAFLLVGLALGPAGANEPAEPAGESEPWTFSVVFENDIVASTDRHYTNGLLASALSPAGQTLGLDPDWWAFIPGHDPDDRRRVAFHLGQSMFTPDDISTAALIPDERPYGGWLHGGFSVVSESKTELRTLSLDLGMVGPASLAEPTQKAVHEIVGAQNPKGWHNQIENEPTVTLAYDHRWQNVLDLRDEKGLGVDFMPHISAALGNAFTFGAVGADIRIGDDLPNDFGPSSIRPGNVGATLFRPKDDFAWYVFAGVEGRVVGRNIFLDGNTFRDSHSVDKKHLVGDVQVGFAVEYLNMRLAYTFVIRSPEFEGQNEPDRFGGLNLTFRF